MKQICLVASSFIQDQKKLATPELQAGGRERCCQMYDLLAQDPHCDLNGAYKIKRT